MDKICIKDFKNNSTNDWSKSGQSSSNLTHKKGEQMKNTLTVSAEKTKDGIKYFSISGTFGYKTYYNVGPFKTRKDAEKRITELTGK
jgi:hypothetical protein